MGLVVSSDSLKVIKNEIANCIDQKHMTFHVCCPEDDNFYRDCVIPEVFEIEPTNIYIASENRMIQFHSPIIECRCIDEDNHEYLIRMLNEIELYISFMNSHE